MGKAADVLTLIGGIAMSENLSKLFTTQFSDVLKLKLQQTQSMLRGSVMEGFHVGKQASPIQYVGAVQMKTAAGRFAPIVPQDVDFTRRWVFPVDKDAAQLVDNFDKLKTAIDPTSQEIRRAAAAVAREWDDRIIGGVRDRAARRRQHAERLHQRTFDTGAGWQIASTFGSLPRRPA
jgi:hypothetical protein